MASSTESKLKSKYDSSSKKIQQLYEQFSSMRKHICTPAKRRNEDTMIYNGENSEQASIKNSIQISIPRGPRARQYIRYQLPSTLNFQTQSLIKSAVLKNLSTCFMGMDKKLDERQSLLEVRLDNMRNLFQQVAKIYKMKSSNCKVSKTIPCKCSQLPELVKEVESKYDRKIATMINAYENKISLLVKEHQDTSDSSNSKNIAKEAKDELQRLEDKLIVKEQEITGLKIELSKLRRVSDQQKVLIMEKQSLIQQLTSEVTDKQLKLNQLSQFKIQKIISSEKSCNDCQILRNQIQTYKQEIVKIKRQLLEANNLKNQRKGIEIKQEKHRRKSWNESAIDVQSQVISDYQNQKDFVSGLKVQDIDDCEPLRHTQYFNSNSRKGSVKNGQKIKQLEAQLQLVAEQNRLLKNKKDKFEEQCKENESDEQKFQMQCQILRDELKNLNCNIKILDQCAILSLKQKKIPQQNVQKLSGSVKFKEQFFKKYPKKRKSQPKP